MSSVAETLRQYQRRKVYLPATTARPMCLNIDWRPQTVIVEGFAPASAARGREKNAGASVRGPRIVWINATADDAYLDLRSDAQPPTLWLHGTAFDLSEREARKLAETLEPVGMRIERQQPITTASTAEVSL